MPTTTSRAQAHITVTRDAFLKAMRDAMALGSDSGRYYMFLSIEDDLMVRAASRGLETWVERRLVDCAVKPAWSPTYIKFSRELYVTIATNMPGAALGLTSGDGVLTLTVGDRSLVIATREDMASHPAVPEIAQPDATFTLDAARLRDVLQRGGFVHGGDDPRHNICGALLRFEPQRGMLSVASTDGALLVLATMPIERAIDARIDALVESDAVTVLAGALFDEPAPVSVALNADRLEFRGPGWRVVTKRQPGVFPAFEKITGTRPPLRVEFLSREMLSALAFVGAGKRVLVQLDVAPGACALAELGGEVDSDRRAALAVVYDGPPFRAVYNAALLASLIESMHPCCVAWSTDGNTQKPGWSTSVRSPTYFRPDGRDDHTCILMPCKFRLTHRLARDTRGSRCR